MDLKECLIIGTILMMFVTQITRKKTDVSLIKSVFAMLCLTISGVFGAFLMFFIENGRIGGISYFGSVLFSPILLFLFSKLLRINFKDYLNISAPAECVMLAVMKTSCYATGCCGGNELFNSISPIPLQLMECLNAILIAIVLIILYLKYDFDYIYAWYLIIYGCVRFCLNFFRSDLSTFLFGLSAGHFWAVISIIIGCFAIFNIKKQDKYNETNNHISL